MSPFRSSRSVALLFLLLIPLVTRSAPAASCRKDPACLRAFARAEAASTKRQLLAAILALQEAYSRLSDPRLLVSIGKLQHRVGQDEQATASCQQAQSAAPADAELQAQAQKCLARAASPPGASPKVSAGATSRALARGGPASATVNNNINVNPQINVSPQVQVSPQFQLPPPPPGERVPIHRKWWLWTGVGLAAAAIAVGIGLSQAAHEPDTAGYPTLHLSSTLTF